MALPNEDQAEVARRFSAFSSELGAVTELGAALVHRAALLTVRLERGYRQEASRLGVAVDGAAKGFEDGRLAAVEHLLETIGDDPATNARRLQQTPEGVALTVEAWKALRVDLAHADRKIWSSAHWKRAENLLGRQTDDLPQSRIGALSRAMWFDFSALEAGEGSGLNDQGRYEYARGRLLEIIDGRIDALAGFVAGFDGAAIDRARLGAADRALFDDSREAVLARKYEAATERSLFRTLRELREVEAAAAASNPPAAEAPAGPEVEAEGEDPAGRTSALGSFLPGEPGGPVEAPQPPSKRARRPRDPKEAARKARRRAG